MKLALAPIPYYWHKEAVYDFYRAVQDSAVDIVYLGETVCAKRHELRYEDWVELGRQLKAAGKEVIFSTQVLLESDTHLNTMRKIAKNDDFPVEANDMGAVRVLANKKRFIAGMHLNIYNPQALAFISEIGASRWVMPIEMNKDDLAGMIALRPSGMEVEVLAYGRLPLAFSARCFTARYYNLPKDDCGFHCLNHPEGLLLKTQEAENFLVLNGIQTQSDRVYCLIHELSRLKEMGVNVLRIVPQEKKIADVIGIYRAVLSGKMTSNEAFSSLCEIMPSKPCNGYWHALSGMEYVDG